MGTISGLTVIASAHPVAATLTRLESLLKEKGILIFARIDFAADAANAGLSMRPEQLLIFGNPKGGTPVMQAQPTAGIDLPLKALVWEDENGQTWLGYNQPGYIVQRHDLPAALEKNLAAVLPLLELAAGA